MVINHLLNGMILQVAGKQGEIWNSMKSWFFGSIFGDFPESLFSANHIVYLYKPYMVSHS